MIQQPLLIHFGRPAQASGWKTEGRVRSIAGLLVLISLALSLVNQAWLWLTVFVGVNLLQSGLTGWCLMSNLLTLGARSRSSVDA